jgi:hypothetical protein
MRSNSAQAWPGLSATNMDTYTAIQQRGVMAGAQVVKSHPTEAQPGRLLMKVVVMLSALCSSVRLPPRSAGNTNALLGV